MIICVVHFVVSFFLAVVDETRGCERNDLCRGKEKLLPIFPQKNEKFRVCERVRVFYYHAPMGSVIVVMLLGLLCFQYLKPDYLTY